MNAAEPAPRRINLALQGGGAHGAFTWGVLDRLLCDETLEISAITGTSAGALNGAALKAGLVKGGRRAARANLDWLWGQMGAVGKSDPISAMAALWPDPAQISQAIARSPGFAAADIASRMTSPYVTEPFVGNPLEPLVETLDFDAVCADTGPAFFVGATNVRTGKIRVFEGPEISPKAILASACLPTMFRAVNIADPETGVTEAYWDGGYTGNPALFPLFRTDLPDDIVIVNINPLERSEVPQSALEIQNRINEISFNSSLLRELRAIAFVKRLIAQGQVAKGAMKDLNVHMIADDGLMNDLSVATKLVPNPIVMAELKTAGQKAADTWLSRHKDAISQSGSVDLFALL